MHKPLISTFTQLALAAGVCGCLFVACRKESKTRPGDNNNPPVTGAQLSDEDSLKYLMYRIMQVTYVDGGRNTTTTLPTYYWYSQVPQLDPLSSNYAKAEDLLNAMKAYPRNGQELLDRYSFLDREGSLANKLQNGIVEDAQSNKGDFGMQVTYAFEQGTNKSHLFVLYADKNSPAGKQGIQRGWEITAVNGNDNITYDGQNGANYKRVNDAIYNSNQVTLRLQKPNNGGQTTITLQKGSYSLNPVLFDTVYNAIGEQPTGYFVFNTFSNVYNEKGAPTLTRQVLDQVFNKFKAAGIRNLVVDLRYNTGGSVQTAEYLDSIIAPAAAQNKVMYYYLYNDKLSSNLSGTGLDASVSFARATGGLGLDRVFFITGRGTASASELTLNNLKPYMDVKLVGDTTFGKPVGFITFTISKYDSTHTEKYLADLYAINFETQNARREGGYYKGIVPDQRALDFVNVPWGDRNNDQNLAEIFSYIRTGNFANLSGARRAANGMGAANIDIFPLRTFNGMIDFRKRNSR